MTHSNFTDRPWSMQFHDGETRWRFAVSGSEAIIRREFAFMVQKVDLDTGAVIAIDHHGNIVLQEGNEARLREVT